ncbi:MAG: hypothetical protein DI538_24325 [Azospira oryzae]|jgi:antitoxin component YwqK of YwqJK toxin-antitoxin module|nr:MAG: hypothetical protein DI538_24325 [Azospira oryzae]
MEQEEVPTNDHHQVIEKLRQQQDIVHAIIGGAAAAIVSALIWATVTVVTKYQIGYLAILIGLLVGFAVRYFGSGIDKPFGFIGAFFALLGCAIGNLLSQVAFVAQSESLGYMEVISLLNLDLILSIYKESFSPLDVLFYAIAAYEGYKFAFRPITDELLEQARQGTIPAMPYANLRLPLVIVLFLAISFTGYFLMKEKKIDKEYKYPSGATMSKGTLLNGKEEGVWNYWWEDGELQATGSYVNGKEDSLWQFYDEEGVHYQNSFFKKGFLHGPSVDLFANGDTSAIRIYEYGRLNGPYQVYHEKGKLSERGTYRVDLMNGEWESYDDNNKLISKGTYKEGITAGEWKFWKTDGTLREELVYEANGLMKIINSWDTLGTQIVKNGNGVYKTFYPDGTLSEVGNVKDGYKSGLWKRYYENGQLQEEGEFNRDQYKVINAWDKNAKQMVVKGEGRYVEDSGYIIESGLIQNGLRTGLWETKYSQSDSLIQRASYRAGKLNGKHQTYSKNGTIVLEGSLVDDKRTGDWIWYHDNGNVETTSFFADGKKQGEQKFYDADTHLLKTEVYKDNVLIETKIE